MLSRVQIDTQKQESENTLLNVKYAFIRKKKDKKKSVCQNLVLRPRFNILTPNSEWADGYKDSSVRQSQQNQVSSWHLKGLVSGNRDKVKGSKRGGILSKKIALQ